MLRNVGPAEVIVIGFVILMLFGSKKLNEIARGLGRSSKEIKKLKKEYQELDLDEEKTNEKKAAWLVTQNRFK